MGCACHLSGVSLTRAPGESERYTHHNRHPRPRYSRLVASSWKSIRLPVRG